MRAGAVIDDLMLFSRIDAAAASAGASLVRASTPGDLASDLDLVLVDWSSRDPSWADALRASDARVILFGRHTDLEAHADARAAGLGPMWARSKLLTSLPDLFEVSDVQVGLDTRGRTRVAYPVKQQQQLRQAVPQFCRRCGGSFVRVGTAYVCANCGSGRSAADQTAFVMLRPSQLPALAERRPAAQSDIMPVFRSASQWIGGVSAAARGWAAQQRLRREAASEATSSPLNGWVILGTLAAAAVGGVLVALAMR
jgi:hypothetical protein